MARPKDAIGYVVRRFPVLSETFILNEILALEAMGTKVEIFSLLPTRDPRFHEGVCRLRADVHYLPTISETSVLLRHARRQAARNPKCYRRELMRVLTARRPKLVWRFLQASWVADRARRVGVKHLHAHFANRSATVAHQASRLLGIPFSFTAHAFDIYRGADASVIARKMADARFTVTISDYNVAFLKALANGTPSRIELVRNGIDMSKFSPARRTLDSTFRIVAVARLVEKKGLPILVEACRTLSARGLDYRCDIIGKGVLRGSLEQMIRGYALGDRVQLLGPVRQQEIVSHYQRAHLLVLPCIVGHDGNRDGLPVSIVEALACGVPVITTPITGIPEAVHDGVNGLIVPAGDALGLADAIEKVMRDPELHGRLRCAARPSVRDAFDLKKTSARLHELLEGAEP